MKTTRMFGIVASTLLLAVAAQADWDIGDPYKMHFPQLPDPNGWNVKVDGPNVLADDFKCTESGLITDVHFWGSWMNDVVGNISLIHLSFHTDDRTGPFSKPGDLLWEMNLDPTSFTIRQWGPHDPDLPQGFYDPYPEEPLIAPNNHGQTWQVNVNIPEQDAFYQEEGNIYWLDIHVVSDWVVGELTPQFGWKTSTNHYEDDAVYEDRYGEWQELIDPETGISLDMAFVVVPEPGAVLLLGVGGVLLYIRKRLFLR